MSLLRNMGLVFLAIVLAGITIAGVEMINSQLYPPPVGIKLDSPEFQSYVQSLPAGAFIIVLAAWFLGTLVGSIILSRWGRAPKIQISILTALFLASGLANMFAIPHPDWFILPGLLTFPAGAGVGFYLGRQKN